MCPIRRDALCPEQLSELDQIYHSSPDSCVCTCVQMVLLCAKEGPSQPRLPPLCARTKTPSAAGCSAIRQRVRPVRCARPRAPPKITPVYRKQLFRAVGQRARSRELPFSL
jgi:hypothetical protein